MCIYEQVKQYRCKYPRNLITHYINVNSIRYKFVELSQILYHHLADFFVIAETKLDDSFPDSQFHIPNFSLYRNDRNAHGGGVMTYVNSTIPHRIRSDLNVFVNNGLEGSIFEINIEKKKWLIAGLYKPPRVQDNVFEHTFCKLLDEMYSDCSNVIVTGDLNFDMNRDNKLAELCNVYGLKNKISGNTCFKGEPASSLDVFLVSNAHSFGVCLNTGIGISDFHNLIGCSLKLNVPVNTTKMISYRSYRKFNTELFHDDLKMVDLDYCLSYENVNTQMTVFHDVYSKIVDKHAPLKHKLIKRPQAPFMNGELKHAIFRKCMLRNKYYRNRSKANWDLYKTQRNLVTKIRKQSIRTYFQVKCENDNNQTNFWATIKPFISKKQIKNDDSIILREGDDIITDSYSVCNIFNDHFSNVANGIGFIDNLPNDLSDINVIPSILDKHKYHHSINMIKSNVSVSTPFVFMHTSEHMVRNVLKNIDVKKSTGFDNIPPRIIKYSIDYLVPFLTSVINKCIDVCIFPSHLKYAEISSIHKKNDKLDKENYRPISILIVVSKVFEKIYSKQMEIYFYNISNPLLSAYRSKYGCHDVLLKLTEEWKYALDNRKFSGALLMDLSKAFDCLPHTLLICKLSAYGFSNEACLLMASYLNGRKQRVKLGNNRSIWSTLHKGVPQGSIMGPLLFNIFVHDLYYDIKKCTLFNYADDNTLFYSSFNCDDVKNVLQKEAAIAIKWYNLNGMKANPDKFQFLVSRKLQNTAININNAIVKSTDTVKLLGVTIDCDLSFDVHISDLCKKASRQLNVLRRFSNILSTKNKMSIFHSFILSQFKYCPVVWHFCKKRKIDMMEKIQERALRFVYNDKESTYMTLLTKANRKTLYNDRLKSIAIEVYKSLHGISPYYLRDMFSIKDCHYDLRNVYILKQPYVNTVTYGIMSHRYHGAKIWNNLPCTIKCAETLSHFKTMLSSYNGNLCNCALCMKCM